MSEEYEIRPYIQGDEYEIVSLLDYVFDEWPKFDLTCSPVEHWRWKYQTNKLKNPVAISLKKGKIVACDHEQLRWIKIGNKTQLCNFGGDSAVHPDHRKKGLFTRMLEINLKHSSLSNRCLSISVTSNSILIDKAKRGGYPIFPSKLKNMILILDTEIFFTKQSSKTSIYKQGYRILSKINKTLYNKKIKKTSAFNIKSIDKFNQSADIFWDKIKRSYNFITRRDQSYLNWRYCDPRGGNYRVIIAENQDEILGFTILRVNNKNPEKSIGYIVDQIIMPGRKDIDNALTHEAIRFFIDSNVSSVSTWISSHHIGEDILKGYGFVDIKTAPFIYYQVYKDETSVHSFVNSNDDQLIFQMGDSDWI